MSDPKITPKITLVSCLRNEGPFLLEWLAHYRAIGVQRFVLFTNDCEDGTDALCNALTPFGVHHIPLGPQNGKAVQFKSLKQAWSLSQVQQADWLLHIDCDEWLCLDPAVPDLPNLIASVETDAFALPWRLFGHSGHIKHPWGRLTAEAFTKAAPAALGYPVHGQYIKTLFKREAFAGFGVHRPKRHEQGSLPAWVDASLAPLPEGFARQDGRISLWGHKQSAAPKLALHHYSVRSVESFMVKATRGLPNHVVKAIDLAYWVERNFNQETVEAILPMMPVTKSALAELRADPVCAALEAEAASWHKARFAQVLQNPDMARLYGQLCLVSSSAALPKALARDILAKQGEAQS